VPRAGGNRTLCSTAMRTRQNNDEALYQKMR
jgi:hypothetical protein